MEMENNTQKGILIMIQSKIESFIEAIINVSVGFLISVLANFIIFPIVGVSASAIQVINIGIFMTFVSVIRSYVIRRFCQANLRAMIHKVLKQKGNNHEL